MQLTGKQQKQLETALLSAFPSRDALQRMVLYQLEQNLATIAGGDNLSTIVFNLITWASANGQIKQLITGAQNENPGNPELRAFVAQMATQPAPQAPAPQATPVPPAPNPTVIHDTYTPYEIGVSELLRRMGAGHPRYGEALTYQQRLHENITSARRYGDTETRRAGRAEIIDRLNAVTVAVLNLTFTDLCNQHNPVAAPGSPVPAPVNVANNAPEPTHSLQLFLAASPANTAAVRQLYAQLKGAGFAPWFEEEDLLPGQQPKQEIPRAVRNADVVIVCLSHAAISQAGQVHKQIGLALDVADEQPEGAIFLIPLRLEACEIPDRLRHLKPVDLFEAGGYERLLRALRAVRKG